MSLPVAPARRVRAEVLPLLRTHSGTAVLVALAGLVTALCGLVAPWVVGGFVDTLRPGASLRPVITGVILLLGAGILGAVTTWLGTWWMGRLTEPAVATLRERVMDSALAVDSSVIEEGGRGDLVSRVAEDSREVSEAASGILPMFVQSAFVVAVSAGAMTAVDWRLGIVGLIAIPMYWLTLRWYLPRSGPIYREERAAFGVRSQRMLGAIGGKDTLTAYEAEAAELARIDAASAHARDLSIGVFRFLTAAFSRNNRAEAVVLAVLLTTGFVLAWYGQVTAGAVATAALLFHRLFNPIGALVGLFDQVQSAGASLGRMVGVIEVAEALPVRLGGTGRGEVAGDGAGPGGRGVSEPENGLGPRPGARTAGPDPAPNPGAVPPHGVDDLGGVLASRSFTDASDGGPASRSGADDLGAVPAPSRDEALVLSGVGHAYDEDRTVLADVDLRIEPAQVVAVVGATGAGKSTLAQIVAGIVAPSSGDVRIGGAALREIPERELRGRIAMVSQEVHVFTGSIADNVRVPLPEASDAQVTAALEAVGADAWVRALPDGLDTAVGDGAHRLTPMQDQMLALARVQLADPSLVVLDEATAEAGSAGAQDLDRAAQGVLRGRSALVVAHRLSQAVSADAILVMEHGRVVEHGTHAELVGAGGRYARLWEAWTAE